MNELQGTSVCFVSVAPGYITKAYETLRPKAGVKTVEATTGKYDIAVMGSWPNLQELQKFVGETRSYDFVRNVDCYPNFGTWNHTPEDGSTRTPATAWTLIRTSNLGKTSDELRKVAPILNVFQTIGAADLVARIGADNFEELLEITRSKIHGGPAIVGTETFPTYEL